ncbi:MAG: SPFH domain-containing protein [Planctomycetota bacterium]
MRALFARMGALVVALARGTLAAARRFAVGSRALFVRALRSAFARAAGRLALRGARIGALGAFLAALAFGVGALGLHRVAPGTIGVLQVDFGGRGIVPRDYESGLHWSLAGWHSWHAIDGRTRMLSYGWSGEPADAEHLKVRTKDGNFVRVGLAVPWRVKRGEAHRLVEEGLKSTYVERLRAAVEKTLTSELGTLSTEDFRDTDARNACLSAALPKLNADLAPLHVEAECVLVELFRFNPEYEIRQQQVQLEALQTIVDDTKRAIAAEEKKIDLSQRETERLEAELRIELQRAIDGESDAGRARIEAVLAEGRAYDQTRKAAATAEFERLVAAGEREVAQADAARVAAENERLASRGGRWLLARRAAENLHVKEVLLDSNDPRSPSLFDLDALVRRFVGEGK